jgi:hypothetical protein
MTRFFRALTERTYDELKRCFEGWSFSNNSEDIKGMCKDS